MRIEAKNLGDAYKKAIDELNCSVTELDIKVVQYPSSGFLGFFKKNAIIEVTRENCEKSHKTKRDTSEKGEQNQGHHKQSDAKIGKKSGLNVQKRDHKNHKDKSDDVRHEQAHKSRQNFLNEQNTALAQAAFADSGEDARRQSEQTKPEYVIKRIDTDGADENLGENLSEKKLKISPMKNILDTSILDNFNQEKAPSAFTDERKKEQKEPIKERTRSFQDLERLVLEGISYHWGRNRNHAVAKNVEINSEKYEVFVNPINTQSKAMDDISLIYNTNNDWMRSGNPGTVTGFISAVGNIFSREAVCYNVGYIKDSNGWEYVSEKHEDVIFKLTAAHEIGHEILKAFGDVYYSYGHKDTVNTVTQKIKDGIPKYPSTGEIDLMKYYQNYYDIPRTIASKTDVLGLLWLTKIKIK